MNNRYYLLRHGESITNTKGKVSCWPEVFYSPLTKKGKKQAEAAGEKLKKKNIDFIFASDLLRTKQTSEIVGKKIGIKPKSDKRLREINVGIFNGMPVKNFVHFWNKSLSPEKYYASRYALTPPKGENYVDVEKRMENFLKEKEKKHKGKSILIVSHERPLTLLEKIVQGYSIKKLSEIIMEKKNIQTGELRELKCK